jgi:hypothetical protein
MRVHFGLSVVQHGPRFVVLTCVGDVVCVDIKRPDVKQTNRRPLGGLRELAGEQKAGKEEGFEVVHEINYTVIRSWHVPCNTSGYCHV